MTDLAIPANVQAAHARDQHDRLNSPLAGAEYGTIPGDRQVLTQADITHACTTAQLQALRDHWNNR